MKINILTIFPEMFAPVTELSLLGKANEKGILDINVVNIRDFSSDKHKKTDETPFGGGCGMVMTCQPVFDAMKTLGEQHRNIYMSPRGKVMDRELIESLSKEDEITILCGHYEGVDQRIIDRFDMEEVSIGDYILTGGELPAMVLIDAVSRFIPEVLGNEESALDESIYSGLLECDQYTKPREYEGLEVPEILFNGNHKLIKLFNWEKALKLTKERRPDLFEKYVSDLRKKLESEPKYLTKDEKKIIDKLW